MHLIDRAAAARAQVFVMVQLALTDMFSFTITFTFWQTAALLARYHVPWPSRALVLLSGFSIANYNLEARSHFPHPLLPAIPPPY
jgi:hypothetical protein